MSRCTHYPSVCLCDRDREVAEAVDAERERWTEAARRHAATWAAFGTSGGDFLSGDYLMWAASMQPVGEDGSRPFSLDPILPA